MRTKSFCFNYFAVIDGYTTSIERMQTQKSSWRSVCVCVHWTKEGKVNALLHPYMTFYYGRGLYQRWRVGLRCVRVLFFIFVRLVNSQSISKIIKINKITNLIHIRHLSQEQDRIYRKTFEKENKKKWLRHCHWHESLRYFIFKLVYVFVLSQNGQDDNRGFMKNIASYQIWTLWTSANKSACKYLQQAPRYPHAWLNIYLLHLQVCLGGRYAVSAPKSPL